MNRPSAPSALPPEDLATVQALAAHEDAHADRLLPDCNGVLHGKRV